MDYLENYFRKKAEAEIKQDMQMEAISKSIMALAWDLGKLLPFAVSINYHGHVKQLCVDIFEPEEPFKRLWKVEMYTTGQLVDLKHAKAVEAALKKAVKFSRIPDSVKPARYDFTA